MHCHSYSLYLIAGVVFAEGVLSAVIKVGTSERLGSSILRRDEEQEATNVTTIYEPDDEHQLCVRADDPTGGACSSSSSSPWLDASGNVIPWHKLEAGVLDDFMKDVAITGTQLNADMNKYVKQGTSRLTEQSSNQNALYNRNYINTCVGKCAYTDPKIEKDAKRVNKFFDQAGITGLDYTDGFQMERYVSAPNGRSIGGYVLAVAVNTRRSVLVSTWPLVEGDGDLNKPEERAYTSTLTWNAWASAATIGGGNPRSLKYHLRDQIFDTLSANVLAATHLKYPKQVDNVILEYRIDEFNKKLDQQAVAGHGKWLPSHPAFATLLAIPHIKSIVNMVIDYNDKMNNNCIAAIHTWPELSAEAFPDMVNKELRRGEILIEFGPSARFLQSIQEGSNEGTDSSSSGGPDAGHLVATS